jgi:hypothetical protein
MKGDDGEDGKAVEEMGKEILLRPDSKTENELKINGKKIIAEIRGTKLKEKEKVETSRAGSHHFLHLYSVFFFIKI